MKVIARLEDHPRTDCLAVVINCGTKWVSSLAVVSLLRNTSAPVLVINCESRDGSDRHFTRFASNNGLGFSWLEWPLRPHADALDGLFRAVPSSTVLLCDSDVEVRTRTVYDALCTSLEGNAGAYGAGFLHGPAWLGPEQGWPDHVAYYAARMWIPFVMLRTEVIRSALSAHASFAAQRLSNEFPQHQKLGRALGLRYRINGLRRIRFIQRTACAYPIDGECPAFVEFDTGATLHRALVERGRPFEALPDTLWGSVHHYHGVTRSGLTSRVRRIANQAGIISSNDPVHDGAMDVEVRRRLEIVYGMTLDGLDV